MKKSIAAALLAALTLAAVPPVFSQDTASEKFHAEKKRGIAEEEARAKQMAKPKAPAETWRKDVQANPDVKEDLKYRQTK
jgi:hypothetical protein